MECLLNKFKSKNKEETFKTNNLETYVERQERWKSIRIMYFTMFLMSLGFTIVLTGVWPYLIKLNPHGSKITLGIIVAANPLGQVIFSPIIGYWANKAGSTRIIMISTLTLFTIANIIYSLLELFPSDMASYVMIFTRFVVGISAANCAVCRSYISSATTVSERTGAVSMISLAQVLGFILGPSLQLIVTPIGHEGILFFGGKLSLNMYNAASLINAILCIINIILFLPGIFTSQSIAPKEAMHSLGTDTEKDALVVIKPNYVAAWSLIVAFFVYVFNFVLLETIGTVLVMDQFAWDEEEAVKNLGIYMTGSGIIALITFLTIKPLCRRFNEINVMLYGGFLFMVIARVLLIPWGNEPPQLKLPDVNMTENSTNLGCPVETQPWCAYTPVLTLEQLLISYTLTSIGYSIGVTLIQTIFSKVLGPRPQGVWMGLLTGSGCLSRVFGPVFISFVYENFGTIWTFTTTAAMMALCTLWIWLFKNRITAPDYNENKFKFQEQELQNLT